MRNSCQDNAVKRQKKKVLTQKIGLCYNEMK